MQMQLKRSAVQSPPVPPPVKPPRKPFPWPSLRAILITFAVVIALASAAGLIFLWRGIYDFRATSENLYRTNRFTGEALYNDGGPYWRLVRK